MADNPELIIREAGYSDIDDILSVTKEAFAIYSSQCGSVNLEALTEGYHDIKHDIDTKTIIAAFYNNELVGCARVQLLPDKTAYLSRFAVKPDNHNLGIGVAITEKIDFLMKKNKITQLSLHTGAKVTSLVQFYRNRGFKIISTENSKGYPRAMMVKEY